MKRQLLILLCFFSSRVFAVGGDQPVDDVINRYTVRIKLLVVRGADVRVGWCSGTLLSLRHVLTAAHCVNGIWRAKVLVGFDKAVTVGSDDSTRSWITSNTWGSVRRSGDRL